MTLKNAAAGLPHGGGKSVIVGDPPCRPPTRSGWCARSPRAIADSDRVHPRPRHGHRRDGHGLGARRDRPRGRPAARARRHPARRDRRDRASAWRSPSRCAEFCGLTLAGARVAVQGFGAVGRHAARFLAERGARPGRGLRQPRRGRRCPTGLDVERAHALKAAGQSRSTDLQGATRIEPDDLVAVDCDIWIPAARPDVLRERQRRSSRARLVLAGRQHPGDAGRRAAHARARHSLGARLHRQRGRRHLRRRSSITAARRRLPWMPSPRRWRPTRAPCCRRRERGAALPRQAALDLRPRRACSGRWTCAAGKRERPI